MPTINVVRPPPPPEFSSAPTSKAKCLMKEPLDLTSDSTKRAVC